MAEHRDPGILDGAPAQNLEAKLQAEMDVDLQSICNRLSAESLEVTVDSIYHHQAASQSMQYTPREIRRWYQNRYS